MDMLLLGRTPSASGDLCAHRFLQVPNVRYELAPLLTYRHQLAGRLFMFLLLRRQLVGRLREVLPQLGILLPQLLETSAVAEVGGIVDRDHRGE